MAVGQILDFKRMCFFFQYPTEGSYNQFDFNGEIQDAFLAWDVITETHLRWVELVSAEADSNTISCVGTTIGYSEQCKISDKEADNVVESTPESTGPFEHDYSQDLWVFVPDEEY